MSLPGLNAVSSTVPETAKTALHELGAETEWRFEVAFGSKVQVKILSGNAEIYGTELATKHVYAFTGFKAAIFSWSGCRMEVTGECVVEYIAEETPMPSYANLHFALENLRQEAQMQARLGPRLMVVGPENSGKTSLVRLLTAYAIRAQRQPVVANIDPREGMLSIPGTITAATFASILDVEEGWGSSPTNGPTAIPVKLPLVYYYGHRDLKDDTTVYKSLAARLGLAVVNKLREDVEARIAGCIIDTPDVLGQGKVDLDVLQQVVSEFSVNVIVVLGSERLFSDLSRKFQSANLTKSDPVKIVRLDKSGGCADRDQAFRKESQLEQIRQYFFGDPSNTLSPHTQQADFGLLNIFKIKEANTSDDLSSLLPGDYEPDADTLTNAALEQITTPTLQLQNAILAIVNATPSDSLEAIRDASVIGFIFVAEVDEKRKRLKILAPVSGRLPSNAIIWGRWPEGSSELVG